MTTLLCLPSAHLMELRDVGCSAISMVARVARHCERSTQKPQRRWRRSYRSEPSRVGCSCIGSCIRSARVDGTPVQTGRSTVDRSGRGDHQEPVPCNPHRGVIPGALAIPGHPPATGPPALFDGIPDVYGLCLLTGDGADVGGPHGLNAFTYQVPRRDPALSHEISRHLSGAGCGRRWTRWTASRSARCPRRTPPVPLPSTFAVRQVNERQG